MKIIKAEKQKNTEMTEYKAWNKIKGAVTKNMKRNIAIICTLVLVAGAIYLNWILFSDNGDYKPDSYVSGEENNQSNGNNQSNAQTKDDGYFALAIIDRAEARAEALEVLASITVSEQATEEAKENAYSEMAKIAEEIECEANIETLVKAKGFEDCVVVISSGKASVIVSGQNLLVSEVAQIKEIVYSQANISPENITIIEKA
ncbi:MAG: SpoIIIAH-like family protein [Clostridia bacterium]|nr:SpoIIIAH-like family protein [Clostridia bacterium]